MPDREKVIRGLECIAQQAGNGVCGECAYFRPFTDDPDCGWCDQVAIGNDALALLREQEPVEPIRKRETGTQRCGICGTFICAPPNRFCPNCGRRVKR